MTSFLYKTFGEAEDLRDTQVQAYIDLVKRGIEIVYLVSDSVSTSKIKPFKDLFPDRLVNVGIAEQNLMGIAAGLANSGMIAVTGNATTFLISRSNEQLKVDISYSNSNVKVNGMHPGFSYGTDGVTHHEVNDIGFIRGMPNFEIFAPCDPRECHQIVEYAILERKGPVYTSLNTGKFPVITSDDYQFKPGNPVQFTEGKDLTIICLGTAVHDALKAAENLNDTINCDIFSVSSIRPLISDTLINSIRKTGQVLTIEQHSTHGGVGSLIAELIAENGLNAKLKRLGVPEGTFTKNWTAPDNKVFFKLDAKGIAETLNSLLA
jgi:transketolase